MSTALEIITAAHRESNLIAIGVDPTSAQQTEGLKKLNGLISSVLGFEVGEGLTDWPVGTEGVSETASNWSSADWVYPPTNARLMVTETTAQTIYLPPMPENGSRVAVVDLVLDAPRSITLDGNGRLIDGDTTAVAVAGTAGKEWIYRADIGQWVLLTTLDTVSNMPFPEKYDAFFETMLAMRLNPRYGRSMDNQTLAVLERSKKQLRADFKQHVGARPDAGVTRMGIQSDRMSGGVPPSPFRRGRYGWMG